MTTRELAELVHRMRKCQRDYFRTKSPQTLQESKSLERRVDQAVEEVLNPPSAGLFDQSEHSS